MKSYKNFDYLYWGSLLAILILKFFLITNLNSSSFLVTYKFFSPDSYDWLANGIRLFESINISFRNPGLPLIINLFYFLKLLFLLPLLNQIIFLGIIFFVFKISLLISKKKLLSYIISSMIFLNYSFQNFANYILADYYAIFFIAISVYTFLNRKYKVSFLLLGISLLFQNFIIVLAPIWFIFLIIREKEGIYRRERLVEFIIQIAYFIIPTLFWMVYKFTRTGDPFFTKVVQFQLLRFHISSLFFYLINFYTLFGILFIALLCFVVLQYKKYKQNYFFIFLICNFTITFLFWVLLYNWNDRRFLLYLIPFFYPLVSFLLLRIYKTQTLVFLLLSLILIYPTYLSINDFFNFSTVPLTYSNNLKLHVTVDDMQRGNISPPFYQKHNAYSFSAILNPSFAETYKNYPYYKYSKDTLFNSYSMIIEEGFDEENGTLFLKDKKVSLYELNSIFEIIRNKELSKIKVITN